MKIETLLLRAAVVAVGAGAIPLVVFLAPALGRGAARLLPQLPGIGPAVVTVLEASAVPFYLALVHAFRFLTHVARGQACTPAAARSLRAIQACALAVAALHLLLLPLFYLYAEWDDAPGVIFVGLFVPFTSLVAALGASLLRHLLQPANP